MIRHCFLSIGFFCSLLNAQTADYCSEAKAILDAIQRIHVEPKNTGSDLDKFLINDFIESLDPKGLYLTEGDVKEIEATLSGFSKSIESDGCPDIQTITELYKSRILESQDEILNILSNPFNYSAKDTLHFYRYGKAKYAKSKKEIVKRWSKLLRYRVLTSMLENVPNDAHKIKNALVRETEIKEKILEQENCKIAKALNPRGGLLKHVSNMLLESFSHSFDPHTSYFTSGKKEKFQSGLSSESMSFGMQIEKNKNGDFIISGLVPGGPAWKSNELHKGDKIIKLQPFEQEPLGLNCLDIYDIIDRLSDDLIEKLVITVMKKDGEIKEITLSKEKLEKEENTIRSYILAGNENRPKVGYLTFPGFYTQWENEKGKSVANDVAKQIIKLKQENIKGLILDLRFNGGGAMHEAQSLAGIFLDYGSLGMAKSKGQKPRLLKDFNRGTIYNGPLVVLTNTLSASASEFLAGALQDYNRAVIVGSQTYGKASAQIIEPLTVKNNSKSFLKITIGKLYRIDGSSHQKEGIKPDIVLPDVYEYFSERETNKPTALIQDTIMKKVFYKPLPTLPIKILADSSQSRIENDDNFHTIKTIKKKQNLLRPSYRLEPYSFVKDKENINSAYDYLYVALKRKSELYDIDIDVYLKDIMNLSEYKEKQLDMHIKDINNDIYIEEAYKIMSQLIHLENQ